MVNQVFRNLISKLLVTYSTVCLRTSVNSIMSLPNQLLVELYVIKCDSNLIALYPSLSHCLANLKYLAS